MQQSIENKTSSVADFSLIELTEILIKNQGIHEGLYNLSVQFQIAVGAVTPAAGTICPGVVTGVSGVGLKKTDEKNANNQTVDAAKVNPAPKKAKRIK